MSSKSSSTTTTTTPRRFTWQNIGLAVLLFLVVAGIIGLIVWLTSFGGADSSGGSGAQPTPGFWVGRNFKWQVVPPVSTNFVKSNEFQPFIGIDDINANWTLITPNSAVLLVNPGSYIIQNVTNNVNLSCDAAGNLSMTTASGTNESWIITNSGSSGYIFRSFTNRYLVAAGNNLTAAATTADAATIFRFTEVVF